MPSDTIDIVSVDPHNGQAELIITVSADQLEMSDLDLKHFVAGKVNACMRYAQSGQLYSEYPANKDMMVTIKVVSELEMRRRFGDFLLELEGIVRNKAMDFSHTVFQV